MIEYIQQDFQLSLSLLIMFQGVLLQILSIHSIMEEILERNNLLRRSSILNAVQIIRLCLVLVDFFQTMVSMIERR
jgi:hypothetical protein